MGDFIQIMKRFLLDEWVNVLPQHTVDIEILDTSTLMHEQFKPALEADPDITLSEKYGVKGIHNVAFYGRPVIEEPAPPDEEGEPVVEEPPTQEEEPVVDDDDEEPLQQEPPIELTL